MILDHLALAEQHVANGEAHLTKQRALISQLDKDGHDTSDARDLLRQFEELQTLHVADRDRLRSKLNSLLEKDDAEHRQSNSSG